MKKIDVSVTGAWARLEMAEMLDLELRELIAQCDYWLRARTTTAAGRTAATLVSAAAHLELDIREAQELSKRAA